MKMGKKTWGCFVTSTECTMTATPRDWRTNYAKNIETKTDATDMPVGDRGTEPATEEDSHHHDNTVASRAESKSRSCRRYMDGLYGRRR